MIKELIKNPCEGCKPSGRNIELTSCLLCPTYPQYLYARQAIEKVLEDEATELKKVRQNSNVANHLGLSYAIGYIQSLLVEVQSIIKKEAPNE